jgi:thymidylate synthase
MEFDTFHQAYTTTLRWVFGSPRYQNAPRGFPSREHIGVQYRIQDATQRVALVPARRLNIVFNFAEALWYAAGRHDLEFIAHYAPGIRKYSADGVGLTGTAYGRAIFGSSGRRDQWQAVVGQLRDDPDSKRAVLQIFRCEELAVPDNPDVSCTLGLQFLLRSGALHAVGFMRANDAYRGMSSDVFSFTFLQELLAHELGVRVGQYTHSVGSLHTYDSDMRRIGEVLDDPASAEGPAYAFPAMPDGDNWPYLREVLRHEEALRTNRGRIGPDLDRLGLPGYWGQVLLLMELHRRYRYHEPADEELLCMLWPVYRWLFDHWRALPAAHSDR